MAQLADINNDCFPELPTELELDILDLTAKMYPQNATRLAMVSKRVQSLIEAIVYETVVLDFPLRTTKLFLRTVSSRSPEFFAKNVKNLYLTNMVTYAQAEQILSVCTGITNLTCWVDVPSSSESLLPLIHTKSLERLSVKVETLWKEPSLNFTLFHELFPNLSHIDIVNPRITSSVAVDWSWIYDLPSLTHLSFGELFAIKHLHILEFLRLLLTNCELLQMLIVISNDPVFLRELQNIDIRDPRLAVLPNFHHPKTLPAYWEGIRRGEPGLWRLGDGTVGPPSGS